MRFTFALLSIAISTLLLFFSCSILENALAKPRQTPLSGFDFRQAMTIVEEIAADSFEGRKSGLASGIRIEEFVAERYRALGLRPAGEDGTYFHNFPMLVTKEHGASMELLDSPYGQVPFLYGNDFTLITNSGSGDVTAEVIVVGHGLADETREWNDYGDTDVSNHIVLIFRGTPDNGYNWDRSGSRDSTLHEAVRRGAAAVLYSQGNYPISGGAVHDGSYFKDVPIAYISHRVVELLFLNTGYDRERYEDELSDNPLPFSTGKRIHIKTEVAPVSGGEARNVVAEIPGTDPDLRNEIIVVGGHMDHIGTDGRGLVFNGANDNGSGAAVVLELARAFAQGRGAERTLVFMNFAGEEQGLLGSEAFVENPTIDLTRVVSMVNLDMVGQGDGTVGIGGGEYYPEVWGTFRASLDSTTAESLVVGRAWGGGSDQLPFRNAGIPVCNIWSEGDHRFYHTIQDDSEWVDPEVLGSVGRMTERWIRVLADWPSPLAENHRAGRELLYGSYQIDLDGAPLDPLPSYVCGRMRWLNADLFAQEVFLDTVCDLEVQESQTDTVSLVEGVGGIGDASWKGRRAHLIGLHHEEKRVPEGRSSLLGDLHVALARWPEVSPKDPDPDYLEVLAEQGVALLAPADTAWASALPSACKAYVRIFANRGDSISDPDRFPRKQSLFILSLEESIEPQRVSEIIKRLGWDRVHLDLLPWLRQGDEREVFAFLEELQSRGSFAPRHMRAILGGNLVTL
jgi:hypothetical protein